MEPLLSQIPLQTTPGTTPARAPSQLGVRTEVLQHRTKEPLQFLDLTEEVLACVARSGVERLRREALNGVPVYGLDGRGSGTGHDRFFRNWQRFGGGIWLA